MSASILGQVPLFTELAPHELAALTGCLRGRQFGRGEIIFQRGDPGSSLYVIESGRVKIVLSSPDGKEVLLTLLGAADFFGDLALLDGEPRSADAVGLEAGRLLVLERRDFLRFLEAHGGVATRLLAVLSRRLRHNADLLQDAAFLDVPARLARLLLELASAREAGPREPLAVNLRLTQSELAGMVGATRESVNKWLRACEREGVIRRDGPQILILRPDELRRRLE